VIGANQRAEATDRLGTGAGVRAAWLIVGLIASLVAAALMIVVELGSVTRLGLFGETGSPTDGPGLLWVFAGAGLMVINLVVARLTRPRVSVVYALVGACVITLPYVLSAKPEGMAPVFLALWIFSLIGLLGGAFGIPRRPFPESKTATGARPAEPRNPPGQPYPMDQTETHDGE
jgi:hypothetical protein